ncbi:programmed cell death protein 7 [Melanotaenia boesemani]|uniref:programmed cell death protein 7 n=1 Tax=Melanotaenia boesemani TaxID=1250792 RepID=UPI001C03DEDE|nr:programmed cell death protein 7 [Melanotaenia boesemani]
MDGFYQGAQRAPGRLTGGQPTPHTVAELLEHPAPRWNRPVYDPVGVRGNLSVPPPEEAGFGGPPVLPPYGFDPLVPPPPFGCPPPEPFLRMSLPAPVNAYGSVSAFQGFSPQFRIGPSQYGRESEADCSQRRCEDHREEGDPPRLRDCSGRTGPQPEDQEALERRQDKQWLCEFLQSRGKTRTLETRKHHTRAISIPGLREALYGAAQLISRLEESCHTLKQHLEDGQVWEDSFSTALQVKKEVQDKLSILIDTWSVDGLKARLSCLRCRRTRSLRARKELQMEAKRAEGRSSEKEAAIDKWRMRRIQQVEEKKKERELKMAADAVLCEVRKKQADVKRMQDVLRALEKLRRLRKEAASRKGIATQQQCDAAFTCWLEQLRCVMKRRTALYSVEEKALMVMLEGEQEEERRREQERRVKKDRERQLQRRRRVDAMLFGEEIPADDVLQPFREFYGQAEASLPALLEIRREWDVFLVAADHPDGSWVPQTWILPEPPSDRAWASALQPTDAESDRL